MNEILKNIRTRRSCRKFRDEMISNEILDEIISAGLYAPSAMNTQLWQITVVKNDEKIVSLQKAVANALDRPDYHRFYGAPVFIIVTVPEDYRHGAVDTACVLENMFLAAHSLGVASVWINQLRDSCNDSEVRKLMTSFGIPENHVCFGCAAIGYADCELPSDRENKGIVRIVE
ncbi:MAG: nitroreductase [Clostridia bacterium]|nr:nitroreductase [Clostridia bacterium]